MKKTLLIGAVCGLIGAAALSRSWWLKSTAEVAALAAGPAPAVVVPDSSVVVLTGRVSAGGNEPVLARTKGRLRSVFFTEGDYVRRGAVLAKLGNHTFVLAPHDGFMGAQQVVAGQYVGRTTVVGTISKRAYLLVPVALPADSSLRVRTGDSVRVWAAARPTRVVTGVAGPVAKGHPAGTSLEVRLTLRAPLRIGEIANVQLHRQYSPAGLTAAHR